MAIFKIKGKLDTDGITYRNRLDLPANLNKRKRKCSWVVVFTHSRAWRELRELAYSIYGRACIKCGSVENLSVDHVKPKSKYPELALDINNLQPLCWSCNKKKGYHDETDYRVI